MPKSTLAVMDYGMGNLRSVANAVRKVAPDCDVTVSSKPEDILKADRVIFPGVGAMRDCMKEIRAAGFDELIGELSANKPMLAICVGMQALLTRSAENNGVDCLNSFEGDVLLFPGGEDNNGRTLKVPHMGWNEVQQSRAHPLWNGIADGSRFYFVHSYYAASRSASSAHTGVADSEVAATCDYGVPFAAAIARGNVFGTQFHPEKSHTHGLQLLENFVNWNGEC